MKLEPLQFPNPERRRTGDLGPNQIAWAKRTIPGFKASKRDADRALKHAARVNEKVRQSVS